MPAPPASCRARPRPVPLAAPPRRAAWRALAASTLYAGAALTIAAPGGSTLPRCDAPIVRAALDGALETIPALAGRGARLRALDSPRERGAAGRLPLRACQGTLVTTLGRGSLEYSIRVRPPGAAGERTPGSDERGGRRVVPTYVVHAELYRDG